MRRNANGVIPGRFKLRECGVEGERRGCEKKEEQEVVVGVGRRHCLDADGELELLQEGPSLLFPYGHGGYLH